MSKFKHLLELTTEKAPGPTPMFSTFHVLRALEFVAQKPIGRGKLADNLEVGEGTVRTIIERMRQAGLVTVSRTGCTLTSKGLKFWKEYNSVFQKRTDVGKSELAFAGYNFAVLVKNSGGMAKLGVDQRDAAVMVGAKGATTILFKKGRLIIPSVSDDVAKDFPEAAKQIFQLLDPKENDVIVIGSADNSAKAVYGTLAAAWTIVDDC